MSVALEGPEPGLRRAIEEALEGRAARLVRIHAEFTGDRAALADAHTGRSLQDLQPQEVFERRWRQQYDSDPPADVLASFHELVDAVHQEQA